jgi:hypothetical protein
MLILDRLISRSSRSLATMIGYVSAGGGRGRGSWSGSPDDDVRTPTVLAPPAFSRLTPALASQQPRRRSLGASFL